MKIVTVALIPLMAVLVATVSFVAFSADRAAHADTGPPDAMSVDMDPTGNDATTLGALEDCIEAGAGDTIMIDVTIEGIPPFTDNAPIGFIDPTDTGGMVSFSYDLGFNNGVIEVSTASHSFLLASNGGSSLFDVSDPLPESDGDWRGTVLDTSAATIPESGEGVLSRLTIAIGGSTPPGIYGLILTNNGIGTATVADFNQLFVSPTTTNNGRIAVDTSCEATAGPTPPPPTPGPTITPEPTTPGGPTPSPTDTPTPVSPTPTGTPDGGTLTPTPTPTSTPDGSTVTATSTPPPSSPTPTGTAAPTTGPTATPAILPDTGGGSGALTSSITLTIIIGGLLLSLGVGGMAFAFRRRRAI